jgi:hypothetical protein
LTQPDRFQRRRKTGLTGEREGENVIMPDGSQKKRPAKLTVIDLEIREGITGLKRFQSGI